MCLCFNENICDCEQLGVNVRLTWDFLSFVLILLELDDVWGEKNVTFHCCVDIFLLIILLHFFNQYRRGLKLRHLFMLLHTTVIWKW